MIRLATVTIFVLVATGFFTSKRSHACPFCSAVSQTLRQEMAVMDAIAIAEATDETVRDEVTGQVLLKVVSVIKGETLVKAGDQVKVVYYGTVQSGRKFMISGADPKDIQWACLPITEVSEKYLLEIAKLPDDPLERLKFYQPYLQHPDGMLNRDAYDEFAITPYPVIQQLKPFMNHDELVDWISEPELPADRKRLYLTMLGVCGSEKDLPMVEEMLRSTQGSTRGGLDALIGCYLVLAGEKGLPLVDELFLKNAKAPYADTYAAIMAIRFHGTETDKIPRSALVQSLHHVLERKDLADLVIPDLARWGDWSQIDRLVQLFIEAEKDNNWIRVPVVNYLRACPKPEAAIAIDRLKEIDPDSVKRAGSVFSIPVPTPAKPPATSMRDRRGGKSERLTVAQSANYGGAETEPSFSTKAGIDLLMPALIGDVVTDSKLAAAPFAPRSEHAYAIAHGLRSPVVSSPASMNRVPVISVLLLAYTSILLLMYLILSGGRIRSATLI